MNCGDVLSDRNKSPGLTTVEDMKLVMEVENNQASLPGWHCTAEI
jgi:hypothetical protein